MPSVINLMIDKTFVSTVVFATILAYSPTLEADQRCDFEGSIAFLALTENVWQAWVMYDDGTNARQVTDSKFDKTRVSWYPDGCHLFVNSIDGHVYRVSIETGDEELIETRHRGFQDAVLAPNGEYFTFSLKPESSRVGNDIWLVEHDGNNPRKITTMTRLQHDPAWSLDSEFIYYLSGDGGAHHNIWRADIRGQRSEQITAEQLFHFDVAVAPDGALAFSNNREGQYDLWVRLEDGAETRLTNTPALDARPTWSPDGDYLAFESNRGGAVNIWRMNRSGRELRQLTNFPNGSRFPVWKPTGVIQ